MRSPPSLKVVAPGRWEIEDLCMFDHRSRSPRRSPFNLLPLVPYHTRNNSRYRSHSQEAAGYRFRASGRDATHHAKICGSECTTPLPNITKAHDRHHSHRDGIFTTRAISLHRLSTVLVSKNEYYHHNYDLARDYRF